MTVSIIKTRRPPPRIDEMVEWDVAEVKWYDPSRKYGFLLLSDGSEVFLHWLALQLSGIKEHMMLPGVRVRFVGGPPDRVGGRPRAERVKII